MPNPKMDCPLCQEKPFESRFGSHLLSRHYRQILSESVKDVLTARLDKLDAGDTSSFTKQLCSFRIKDASLKICLVCKKSYSNEKGKDHYKNHLSCAEGAKESLRLFLNPPTKKVRVKKDKVTKVDTKEIESLKKQNLKLEKEIKLLNSSNDDLIDENDKYLKYLQKLYGSDNIDYIIDCIDDLENSDKFKSYKDLLDEQNFKDE